MGITVTLRGGSGDMTKAVYDSNLDGVIAMAQLDTLVGNMKKSVYDADLDGVIAVAQTQVKGFENLASVQVVTNGAAAAWADVDCEATVGTGKSLLFVKVVKTNNNGIVYLRTSGAEDAQETFDLLIDGIAYCLISAAGHFDYYTTIGYAQIYLEGFITVK